MAGKAIKGQCLHQIAYMTERKVNLFVSAYGVFCISHQQLSLHSYRLLADIGLAGFALAQYLNRNLAWHP